MLSCCCPKLKSPLLNSTTCFTTSKNRRRTRSLNLKPHHSLRVSAAAAAASLYQKFIDLALCETKRHVVLESSPLQEYFNNMIAMDGKTELQMLSYQAPKIRLLRSMDIHNEVMQVLDFAVFPKPEFDLPIFCANFFTSASTNIILLLGFHPVSNLNSLLGHLGLLAAFNQQFFYHGPWEKIDSSEHEEKKDLNPLHNVISNRDYKDKYYTSLMPLGLKYSQLLPWGGKLTSESIKFFSPIVIWTKFTSSQEKHDILYSAFVEYYKAWLELVDQAVEETNISQIMFNCEAQHRYLTWRAEKDPGHGVLKKLIGETHAKDLLRNFLFKGVDELGSKKFLSYFPEYCCEDGTVSEKRSIIGKSFENRPWDSRGEFVGNNF